MKAIRQFIRDFIRWLVYNKIYGSPYCAKCGACGEEGCCPKEMCKSGLFCWNGEWYKEQLGGHTCPVCGYDDMTYPPDDCHICECCGTEFEVDDIDLTFSELRAQWIEGGCKWWSTHVPPPEGWNAEQQLIDLAQGRSI